MPWHLSTKADGCSGFAVVQDSNGKVVGCHKTKAKAQAQLAALNINAKEASMGDRAPKENLVRAMSPGLEYEVREEQDAGPKMVGHFAVFDEWTEVESMFEGHFLERNAPGAFSKTIAERADRIQATFNHGHDPDLGDKVLGNVVDLHEDDRGVAYEVDMFPSVPPLLMDGLRAGKYGSSYRFRVLKEEWDDKPHSSDHNPTGLPERTVREAEVYEFGPVTYPAYAGATAGIRSMTDEFMLREPARKEPQHLAEVIAYNLPKPAGEATSVPKHKPTKRRFSRREDYERWLSKN